MAVLCRPDTAECEFQGQDVWVVVVKVMLMIDVLQQVMDVRFSFL